MKVTKMPKRKDRKAFGKQVSTGKNMSLLKGLKRGGPRI